MANGPDIFQMILVYHLSSVHRKVYRETLRKGNWRENGPRLAAFFLAIDSVTTIEIWTTDWTDAKVDRSTIVISIIILT